MRPAALLLLVPALACQAPDTSAAAKQAIDAANANWARLTAAGHADSIAEFYHENGVIMPPNMARVQGREGIRAFFAEMNPLKPTLSLRADSVWGSGNMAVEQGRWHFAWAAGSAPPGAPPVDSGKYLARWVNDGGRWLMVQDVWNSDLPTPTAPPAPASRR
jgi:ketosteroid isomerase-like protein